VLASALVDGRAWHVRASLLDGLMLLHSHAVPAHVLRLRLLMDLAPELAQAALEIWHR